MGKGNSRGSRTLADNSGGEVSGGLGVCAPYNDPEYGDGGSTCRYRSGVSTLAFLLWYEWYHHSGISNLVVPVSADQVVQKDLSPHLSVD
jgi:hypothetical protein